MTLPLTSFYFLRHGETDWNKRGLIMGSIDGSLNDHGIEQARAAGRLLKKATFDRIVCSPRKRACETARCIMEVTGKPLYIEDDIVERVLGEAEGQPSQLYKSLLDEDFTPKGAETFAHFTKRVVAAMTSHLTQTPHETILFVSHGGVFKAITHMLGHPNLSSDNATPYLFRAPVHDRHSWVVTPL